MIKLLEFFKICFETLFTPTKAVVRLENIKNKRLYGFSASLVVLMLYIITTIFCWISNVSVSWAPILPINPNEYYFFQIFFGIPIGILTWLIFTIICFLFLKRYTNELKFNDILYTLSFPFNITMLPLMWTTETILIIFFTNLWNANPYLFFPFPIALIFEIYSYLYLILTMIWALLSITLFIKYLIKSSFLKSLAISIVSYLPALLFMMVFIR